MRCVRKGYRVWVLSVIALLGALLFLLSQGGIEAQTTQPPSTASPPAQPSTEAAPPTEGEESETLALDFLPKAKLGYVDWVAAITKGYIKPVDSLDPNTPTMPPLNFDVVFKVDVSGLPDVVYPHYPHTIWLDCRNCHPSIFLMRAGANPVTMAKILKGEFCGRCHGVVAFPISDCFRCHSRPK